MAAAADGGGFAVNDFMTAAALDLAKAYAVRGGFWAPYPCDDSFTEPAFEGPAKNRSCLVEDTINKGTVCVAIASGAIFASATAWEHIGEISRGEEVVAAGPPITVDFYTMVPIKPEGAIDRALLELYVPRVESPCLVGNWNNWEIMEMVWDEIN